MWEVGVGQKARPNFIFALISISESHEPSNLTSTLSFSTLLFSLSHDSWLTPHNFSIYSLSLSLLLRTQLPLHSLFYFTGKVVVLVQRQAHAHTLSYIMCHQWVKAFHVPQFAVAHMQTLTCFSFLKIFCFLSL